MLEGSGELGSALARYGRQSAILVIKGSQTKDRTIESAAQIDRHVRELRSTMK
jgi:predicted dinucleotide-binding enzyme